MKNYRQQHYFKERTMGKYVNLPDSLHHRIRDLAHTYTAQQTSNVTMTDVMIRALDIGIAQLESEQREALLNSD